MTANKVKHKGDEWEIKSINLNKQQLLTPPNLYAELIKCWPHAISAAFGLIPS